ncbi:hypothetical protein MMA231_00954 [Asticcacaulis sp. MM231]|uniref:hypothetical protein n=1 Tax=Asticcacaulis sp. MM231 TaxID=3157666 RepID=UPI0032D586E4
MSEPDPVEPAPIRDPLVDRARSIYLYVVALIALVQGVGIPVAAGFGITIPAMSLMGLMIIVAPAIAFMFGKSFEQVMKAWKAVRP